MNLRSKFSGLGSKVLSGAKSVASGARKSALVGATVVGVGLMSLLGPSDAKGAMITINPDQPNAGLITSDNGRYGFFVNMENNDAGSEYNSAEILGGYLTDLATRMAEANPSMSASDYLTGWAGDNTVLPSESSVSPGWSAVMSAATGDVNFTHEEGRPGRDYGQFTDNENLKWFFGGETSELDVNGNGIYEPLNGDINLSVSPTEFAEGAFKGYEGGTFGRTFEGNIPKVDVTVVPEPTSAALVGVGALALAAYRRRKEE